MSPDAKKLRIAVTAAAFVALVAGAYAFLIEPYQLVVSHHHVRANISLPLKIAHLSDLHTYGVGRREQKVLDILDGQRLDLIVITGDSIDTDANYAGFREVLNRMRAPLGVWVVRGNHEVWWPIPNEQSFYESAGAKLLVNTNERVRDDVWLVGLDDSYAGAPNLERALSGVPSTAYRIALFHSPAFFDRIAGKCDLALAGHSHGGQIRLPVIGPVWLPPETGRYVEGWFEKDNSRMYVSRGIGTAVLAARFLCNPEIAIITLGE
ncbi:MAG: metallophosphoesterase [Blastocatellia bacterium]